MLRNPIDQNKSEVKNVKNTNLAIFEVKTRNYCFLCDCSKAISIIFVRNLSIETFQYNMLLYKEIGRYRRDTTIGTGVLSTNKVAHVTKDRIFYFV